MARKYTRSPFARASGPAKEGVEHWWRERVTAVALIPLTLWLVAAIIGHSSSDYSEFVAWLKMPFATCMMVLLLIALFYHTALGLQVIIEDYVHSGAKVPALILMRLACFGFLVAGILAVLRIALGS